MSEAGLAFYATPSAMSRLPSSIKADDAPSDLDEMRRAVQGLTIVDGQPVRVALDLE